MFSFIADWNPLLAVVALLVGFVFLVKGADFFVEGSSSVAKRFHVPSIIIGLTIVAMGTSLPEAAVSISASMQNANSLAISNAVGSNIFNMMVGIGVCAVLTPVAVQKQTLVKDFPFSVVCALALLGLGVWGMTLGRVDGIVLLVLFAVFIGVLIRQALKASKSGKAQANESIEAAEEIEVLPMWKNILFIVGGGAAIALGGDVVVESSRNIAVACGMSETLVGLTIVSIGTSLPELVTSFVAAKKNEVDMALGNAIGSNVFNILFVLGLAATISPIGFITENIIDIVILCAFSLVVWLMAWTKRRLDKGEGLIMVLLYAAYVAYIIMRNYHIFGL